MPFEFKVSFDPKPIENELMERFGAGSKAQYAWSEMNFNRGRKYMPMVTSTFINQSYIASEPLFGQGELVFVGPHGHFLWEGIVYVDPETGSTWARAGVTKIPIDKALEYNRSGNPLAGARWTERMANAEYDIMRGDFQRMIDAGIV